MLLVHELVHQQERQHNARFKDLMDKFLPNLARTPRPA
ncbi:YgjP-like metallopeptidase domain-containing protein [Ferrimonas lipolytica]|nr:YgjP-like metallopeptidase domain-containing protein [Ferrimonas lipolytica]